VIVRESRTDIGEATDDARTRLCDRERGHDGGDLAATTLATEPQARSTPDGP
jgi:hypothetical protein